MAFQGARLPLPEWRHACLLQLCKLRDESTRCTIGIQEIYSQQVVGAVAFQGARLPLPQRGDACLLQLCEQCMASEPAQRPKFPVRLCPVKAAPCVMTACTGCTLLACLARV